MTAASTASPKSSARPSTLLLVRSATFGLLVLLVVISLQGLGDWQHYRLLDDDPQMAPVVSDDHFCRAEERNLPYIEQLSLDLKPWRREGITAELLQASATWYRNKGVRMGHFFHMRNNQMYISFSSQEEEDVYLRSPDVSPRSAGMIGLLLLYTCFVKLPDMDGFLTFDDRAPGTVPFVDDAIQNFEGMPDADTPPFFVFQKKINETGILLPWFSHLEFNAEDFSRQAQEEHPWETKENKMLWRGATTGGEYRPDNWKSFPRTKLVLRCMEDDMKDLCDAGFIAFVQTGNPENAAFFRDQLGVKPSVPLMDQMHFKYLPLLNGNGPCAGRSEKFFSGNSLVLKEESANIEFYYQGLKPNKHYLPIHSNMSNLKQQVEWALENDQQVLQIISNMILFAKSIQPASVACYIRELFQEYAKLLRYDLKPIEELGPHVHQVFPMHLDSYPNTCRNAIDPCDFMGLEKFHNVYVRKNVGVAGTDTGRCHETRKPTRRRRLNLPIVVPIALFLAYLLRLLGRSLHMGPRPAEDGGAAMRKGGMLRKASE